MACTICVLKRHEDSEKNDCKNHFHVKKLVAMEWTGRGHVKSIIRMAEWCGPHHIRMLTASWKIVRSGPYGLGYTQLIMEQ